MKFVCVFLVLVVLVDEHVSWKFPDEEEEEEEQEAVEGVRQSPIDINNLVAECTKPLKWKNYGITPRHIDMYSDGHSIVLKLGNRTAPSIHGGPLNHTYHLHSIHFHWSNSDDQGSEHTVNGWSFPMEMHVVHIRDGLTYEEATNVHDGIAVIGYFMKLVHQGDDDMPMECLTNHFKDLKAINKKIRIEPFHLSDLVLPFCTEYVTYLGSLTTPPFHEVVVWFVSPRTVRLTEEHLQRFRDLFEGGLVHQEENSRETQPLNMRKVMFACLDDEDFCEPINHENVFKEILDTGCPVDNYLD